jgi:heat shock protein HtpX
MFVIMVFLVASLVRAIAPLVSRLVQLAASQEREYLADATAVELGRNPEGLERALAIVASTALTLPQANRSTAPLYFVDPIRRFEERADRIWSTHPPTLERINRLRGLQGEPPLDEAIATTFLEDRDRPEDIRSEGAAAEGTIRAE